MANADDTDADGIRDDRDRALAVWARRALERKYGALPPASTLDDELLVRYVDGALSGRERQELEARLLVDLDAKDRVGILVGALHEEEYPSPRLPDGWRVKGAKVTRYVFHVAAGLFEVLRGDGIAALEPALAVRSGHGGTGQPTAFQIERELQTSQGPLAARIELHADITAHVDVIVRIGSGGHPATGVRVKLLRDGLPVDSREIEEAGCTFAHLDPACYELELRKGGVEVGKLMLDLRG